MMKRLIFFALTVIPFFGVSQTLGSGRIFSNLDSALIDPENVQSLRFDSEDIVEIDPRIVKLTNLRGISLSHNQRIDLVDLFDKLSMLPKLKFLNLSDCEIETLPSNISKLSQLKRLMLGNNKLTALPSEIKQLTKLKELIFSQYPEDFRRLTEGQKLKMLSQLPHVKILLTEYSGGTHGYFRLGAKTVRVTKSNLWANN